jgi:uncharacterized repeat protein (TIGR03803 family)
MMSKRQRSIFRQHRRPASSVFSLAMVFVPVHAAMPPAQEQTLTVLHSFTSIPDGAYPFAGLIRDGAGSFYGTTSVGGNADYGAVFKIDATGKETLLHSFTGSPTDGASPYAGLIRDAAGNLYGTTSLGGASSNCLEGCGTVFKIDATGSETVLYSFTGTSGDGADPMAGLVRDAAGNLYGTTANGGTSELGTVFKVDKTGRETVLHSFTGYPTDGAHPWAGLLRDAAGNLYGTTYGGGTLDYGTVFKLDTTGKETVFYSFQGYPEDGSFPQASLVQDATGNLYGTTTQGGTSDPLGGTVFKLDVAGQEVVLYSFTGGTDGADPIAGLLRDASGNLYGTTYTAGASHYGTVFKVDQSGRETVLHNFASSPDGAYPDGALITGEKSHFYGTSHSGGSDDFGTVFELTINPGTP